MPSSCSVKGCNSRHKAQAGISFFRFPLKDKQRLQVWISAVGRKKWAPTSNSKICSLHFLKTDLIVDLGYKNNQLKPGAVPSQSLPCGSVVKAMATDSNKEKVQPPNTTEPIEPEKAPQIEPSIQQCTNYKSKDNCVLQTQKTMSNVRETAKQAGEMKSAFIYLPKEEQNKQSRLIVVPVQSNCMKNNENLTHESTRADVNEMEASSKQSANKCKTAGSRSIAIPIRSICVKNSDSLTHESTRADVNDMEASSKRSADECKSACTSKKQKTAVNAEQSFRIYQIESNSDESSAEDSVESCTEYSKMEKIDRLAKKVKKLTREVKTLKQKLRRRDQKICEMTTLLKTLMGRN